MACLLLGHKGWTAAAAFPVLFGEESIRENGIMTHEIQKVQILFNGELTFSKKNCAFIVLSFLSFILFFFLANSIPHRFFFRDSYAILNMFPRRQIDKQMHNKTAFFDIFRGGGSDRVFPHTRH